MPPSTTFNRSAFEAAQARTLRRAQLWTNARRRLGAAFLDNLSKVEAQIAAQLESEFRDRTAA